MSPLKVCVKLLAYPSLPELFREYFDVPRIILEYIDGFPLTDLEYYAPKVAWQSVCEDAIRMVNLMSDRNSSAVTWHTQFRSRV
jgi:hypothetical protein